ncbi:MAG: secondary thiamine-phosphate synthase enzyme YjbQ [Candidatus Aenigmarchaeota archaeon]|nr:secondary thiamine-phosphate synthase enzyme YjbQ [Candidatus Aenigmarchaeota archaeon]
MEIFTKRIAIQTSRLYDFVEITDEVQKAVSESRIKDGIVFASALHNTAALIIQEDDSTVHRDLINTLERIVPLKGKYEHDMEGNVNATAHLKSNLLGTFVTVPLKDGRLVLGTWQRLFFVELFEPRRREVVVTVVGE